MDLSGRRFGRLVVTGRAERPADYVSKVAFWLCQCDCGSKAIVASEKLKHGRTRSCGCLKIDFHNRGHGHNRRGKRSTTYNTWAMMKNRCLNPAADDYADYGGRGISVCDDWLDFKNFIEDMGERPAGKTLDRKNNDGNYDPGNCRWATASEQALNRRPKRVHHA